MLERLRLNFRALSQLKFGPLQHSVVESILRMNFIDPVDFFLQFDRAHVGFSRLLHAVRLLRLTGTVCGAD